MDHPFDQPFIERISVRHNISSKDLTAASLSAQRSGMNLGEALVKRKLLSEEDYCRALAEHYALTYSGSLDIASVEGGFAHQIPIQFLKQHLFVPLVEKQGGKVTAAVYRPDTIDALDDLSCMIGRPFDQILVAPKTEILSAINFFYDKRSDNAQKIVDDLVDEEINISDIKKVTDLLEDTSDAPIIKLVNQMISQSVKAGASDIHIEPMQDTLKIRYRIDGILYDLLEPPKWLQSALVTRIKVMADMDIAEKRLPQDSRIEVRIGNRDIDIRISSIPTTMGERIVLRLLDKSSSLLTLSQFGLAAERLKLIERLSELANGIILMTGPTGSGKTTTLYAILSQINKPDINIITVEDPVEYKLAGINQIQVNPKIGLTFAKSLRSIVRQDPDVILVGEIRDPETASIAVQSALTGHLVFSTLHTNDSASAITRLVDMEIEPFLITSSVRAVMAQRLIRMLCPDCKSVAIPDPMALKRIGLSKEDIRGRTLFQANGCPNCFHTGYKGRMPLFEILMMTPEIKSLVLTTSDANRIAQTGVKQGMTTLIEDGIDKVLQGVTTIEEILRVTQS